MSPLPAAAFISHLRDLELWLTNKADPPSYKVTLCLPRTSRSSTLLFDIRLENVKWNLFVCLCVLVRVVVCTLLECEADSKCHFVVWGRPSRMYSSCRRCCHPPSHCLCKWCLQSPSDTWSFSASLCHSPSPASLTIVQIVLLSFCSCCLLCHSQLRRFYLKGLGECSMWSMLTHKVWQVKVFD